MLDRDLTVDRFRAEVRRWIGDHLPEGWRHPVLPPVTPPGRQDPVRVEHSRGWQAILHEARLAAPGWPEEHGGRSLDLARRLALAEELALARAPAPIGFQGIDILGPTLIAHGDDEQRARFLPGIVSGEEIWCQGYSEPGAGSDLAALRTTAVRDSGKYVVNGQKVWTSFGDRATWCFLLARTGAPDSRHRGISFFVVAMDTPGIEWRPLTEISGGVDFGELFLDDVAIPESQRIGPEGAGWKLAMASLHHERLLASNVAHLKVRLDAVLDLVREAGARPADRDRAAKLVARFRGLEGIQSRALALALADDPGFATFASLLKLAGTELRCALADLAVDLIGPAAAAATSLTGDEGRSTAAVWAHEAVQARGAVIYAGSSEIQRNILAERGLGLPKDA
ncbi:MAG TPA: acyl-CoA dehydrogenase family protein [Iamia sp.]|nr:acyl-CoA dehydrogenase family protein [Iamia sp.]